MSRKRDKNKSQECQCPKCQNKSGKSDNGIGDNPFGINPSQLLGMLGNADMGQIGNILSSMNTDGFDFNNLNFGSIQNMMSGNGANDNHAMSSIQEMMANMNNMQGAQNSVNNSMNVNNKKSDHNTYDNSSHHRKNKKNDTIDNIEVDENIELLMSIRKIVDYDRAKFIDKVIELYKEGVFEEE